jgi:protein-S-isoprenylcysteine O-methyltransferase Ste14
MIRVLYLLAWLACVVYSTIPAFWFMIHPFAEYWRARRRNPYLILVPAWIGLWAVVAGITLPWRLTVLYHTQLLWIPAVALLAVGIWLYTQSGKNFSREQLGGFPEVRGHHEQRLITEGIRARVRHPVYLAHLCEMTAWSIGSGLAVSWGLTAFAMVTGAVMIWMEDRELEERFGSDYRGYRSRVPALFPKMF